MEQADRAARGMVWRTVATIVTVTAFLVGSLIFVGFYAGGYSLFQKIVVVLVAIILAIAAVSIIWISWAGRRGWLRGTWGP